tara:strand:+ start:116 stop:8218 length:8103 start_codon:yes stop_codon:yes gene_type:complete
MPEIKRTFTAGKMNKDLDERVIKNGEYRHAVNVQVRTTDGDESGVGDAGSVQNIKGNTNVGQVPHYNWNIIPNVDTSITENNTQIIIPGQTNTVNCVATVADEKNDNSYFFFAAPNFVQPKAQNFLDNDPSTIKYYVDSILEHNSSGTNIPVFVDVWAITCSFSTATGNFTNGTYTENGWAEMKISNALINSLRVGMRVKVYLGGSNPSVNPNVDILNNNAIIKAIDYGNGNEGSARIMLYGEQTAVISNSYNNTSPAYISFEAERTLNFSGPQRILGNRDLITAINVIDDFIIWSDGFTEPKKISISRCKAGTNVGGVLNNYKTHTKLYINNPETNELIDVSEVTSNLDNGTNGEDGSGLNSDIKEEHITVIRKSPRTAPTLDMKASDREGVTTVQLNNYGFGSTYVGDIKSITGPTGSVDLFLDTKYRKNDILEFVAEGDNVRITANFICYEDSNGEEILEVTNTIKVSILTIGIVESGVVLDWTVSLQQSKPLFETKLVRFGYRYKYSDGEYSSFSPWSELAFLPADFDYKINKGYNLGMINNVRELIVKDFIPYKIPLDVTSIDLLYKTTDSPNVYIVETIEKEKNREWELFTPNGVDSTEIKTGQLAITSEMIHRVLPSSQTLRAWDNVPRYAFAQEIVGSRLLYGNYTQGYNIGGPINLTQTISSKPIAITDSSQPPNKSIKSIRDYKVGMVFGDKYGRETPVISSGYVFTVDEDNNEHESITGDISVNKSLCAMQNSLIVSQNWDNNGSPDSWIDYVKYYVKETSNEYYNLVMDRWYNAGDSTVWLSFNSADRNKVDEETYLILKNRFGNHVPVLEDARYKIIAIENEAPDFIKTTQTIIGEVGKVGIADVGAGVGGLEAGNTEGIWATGVDANTGIPAGLMGDLSCKVNSNFWGTVFDMNSDSVFGRKIEGDIHMRVVGRSWTGDSIVTYKKETPWRKLTGFSSVDDGDRVLLTWDKKWFQDADFFNFWTNGEDQDDNGVDIIAAELVYSFEFKESITSNKPEFDGKFFVKIEQDIVLQSEVMTLDLGYEWITESIFDLSYISSTVQNEGQVGPNSADEAVFSGNDVNSSSWFYSAFMSTVDALGSTGVWTYQSVENEFFESGVLIDIGTPWQWDQSWDYGGAEETYGLTNFNGMGWMGGGYGMDNNYLNTNSDTTLDTSDSAENSAFNQLANFGVFGSCTWGHNQLTKEFWQSYMDEEKEGYNGTIKNNAFIDGAKVRMWDNNGPAPEDFKTPDSFSNDGLDGIGLGSMTISRLTGEGESAGAVGLMNALKPGEYFSFGTNNDVYQVVGSEVENQEVISSNYSTNWYNSFDFSVYDTSGNELAYNGEVGPYANEDCLPCSPNPQQENLAIAVTTPSTASNTVQIGAVNQNSGEQWGLEYVACSRASKIVKFRKVDTSNAQVIGANANTQELGVLGLNPDAFDPRGEMYHDGRNCMTIVIKKPVSIQYSDDSLNNELGACWETEPKKDSDLDIYYEASNAIPVRLNEQNAFDFTPVNSTIQVQRLYENASVVQPNGSFIFVNGEATVALISSRKNHRVNNVHFSDDSNKDAIISIVSDANNGTTSLHTSTSEIGGADIQIGDNILFTHPNGTITKGKVTGYYRPIETQLPPPNLLPSFNDITTSDTNIGITSGPKAFEKFVDSDPVGYYGISINVWEQPVQLPWFNCYAFGNGVESDRIRDDFNAPQIDNGVKVSTTFSGYKEENIKSGLIYSGLYNSTSQVNNLNEFNMSEKITKELNPMYGSIQALKTRDSDVVVLAEDKILKVLATKDALFNADGNSQLLASDRVLGTAIPFVGDYGISKDPESIAVDQYRMYFTDKQRGAVLRLSRDGLTPISSVGMKSWFRDNLKKTESLLGSFDVVNGEYNLTFNYNLETPKPDVTISFNEASKGWVSFKTFIPHNSVSVSGDYFTTRLNKIFLHNVLKDTQNQTVNRNTFYGEYGASRLKLIMNDQPSVIKSFTGIGYEGSQSKVNQFIGTTLPFYSGTFNYAEGSDTEIISVVMNNVALHDNEYYNLSPQKGWYVASINTGKETWSGKGEVPEFMNKEGKWFNRITGRVDGILDVNANEFIVQGIGQVASATAFTTQENDGTICEGGCNDGQTCIDGECIDQTQLIFGCTDPDSPNYDETAEIDDGSCESYELSGCMDQLASNYNQFATSSALGGQNACNDYVYGCQDTNAINYITGADVDGQCFYLGVEVPCIVIETGGQDDNTNQWPEGSVGEYDTNSFVPIQYYSCLYQTQINGTTCPSGLLDSDGNCVDNVVVGCMNPDYENFNPQATVSCTDGCCGNLSESEVYGCMDIDACNYNPLATISATLGLYACEYQSCVGCMDETMANYNENATVECSDCCMEEVDNGINGADIPGCMNPAYQEYCGPGNTNGIDPPCTMDCWTTDSFSALSQITAGCGNYFDANGTIQQLGPCNCLVETGVTGCADPLASNYNPEANGCYNCLNAGSQSSFTYQDLVYDENGNYVGTGGGYSNPGLLPGANGCCTYELYGCTDTLALNYDFANWQNGVPNVENTTLVDDGSCEYPTYGCTNPLAINYDEQCANDPQCFDNGACLEELQGCMSPNAIGYQPYFNSEPAPNNPNFPDGCPEWVYGCMNPEAINYNPLANSQTVMVWQELAPGSAFPLTWTNGLPTGQWVPAPSSEQVYFCNFEEAIDGSNSAIVIQNNPDDSAAGEDDVVYGSQ